MFPISSPISYISCGNLVSDTPWVHSARVIDTFELIVGVKGEVYIQQDDDHCAVKPGSSLILLPDHHHRGYAVSQEPISFYWAHFRLKSPAILENAQGLKKIKGIADKAYSPYSNSSRQAILPLFHDAVPDSKLDILFHQLLHLRSNPVYTPLAADYAITSILIQLTENILREVDWLNRKNTNKTTFEKSLEWIRENFNTDISIKQVASKYHYNAYYYSRIFHAHTEMRLLEYINTLRVSKAKILLYESELSVKEIAYQIGFNNEKYFMRVFKEKEGISPSQYRNAFYKTHQNKS